MDAKNIIPEFWSSKTDGTGCTVLTYAIRSGKAKWLLALLGTLFILGGGWGAYWLLAGEGELTIAGVFFVLLVPGAAILFGMHCLATAFWNHTRYRLCPHRLEIDDYALMSRKTATITHASVSHIEQQYFPPSGNSPSGDPGTWTTFVYFNNGGKVNVTAFKGMGSEQERDWLGPILAAWANKPLRQAEND